MLTLKSHQHVTNEKSRELNRQNGTVCKSSRINILSGTINEQLNYKRFIATLETPSRNLFHTSHIFLGRLDIKEVNNCELRLKAN